MLLDPKIVAAFWLQSWDEEVTEREKQLCGWVNDLMWTAWEHDADHAWAIVEAIHAADTEQKHIGVFAAGPLEDLLRQQGEIVIARVEEQAKCDPAFAKVLGGVWGGCLSEAIWTRVKAVRDTGIWSDARD